MYTPHRGKTPTGGCRSYGGRPTFGVWDKTNCRFIFIVRGATHRVHRLVAEAFHGLSPFEDAIVMHIDENSANNRADNLKWGTVKENMNAEGYIEYCRNRAGENSTYAKRRIKNGITQ